MGVLPPNRPDAENLSLLDATVSQLRRKRVAAVLGSTPEYRSRLDVSFDTVLVLERSLPFKESVDWMCGGNTSSEQLVLGDWLETLPSLAGCCDLVVSHYTHGNIAFDRRDHFYELVARSLAPGGLFFDTIFQPELPLVSAGTLERKYSLAPLNLATLNHLNCDAIFLGEHVREAGYVDSELSYQWVAENCSEGIQRLMEAVHRYVTPRGYRWDYAVDRACAQLGYHQHFTTLTSHRPTWPSPFQHAVTLQVSEAKAHVRIA